MVTSYKIILSDNNISLLYHENDCIYYSRSTHITNPVSVIKSVLPNFSAGISQEGMLYVFSYAPSSDIFISRLENDSFVTKPILKLHSSPYRQKISFYAKTDTLCIIANSSDNQLSSLMYFRLDKNGWSTPQRIDTVSSQYTPPYLSTVTSPNTIGLIYYLAPSTLIYRNVSMDPFEIGESVTISRSTLEITDISSVFHENTVHITYIAKGTFSTQLVYKTKTDTSTENVRVLYEGRKIDDCVIFSYNEKLFVMWKVNSVFMYTVSENNGHSFSTVKTMRLSPDKYIKAEVVIHNFSNNFSASELFISSSGNIILPSEVSLIKYSELNIADISEMQPAFSQPNSPYSSADKIKELENQLKLKDEEITKLYSTASEKLTALKSENKSLTDSLDKMTVEYNKEKMLSDNLKLKISMLEKEILTARQTPKIQQINTQPNYIEASAANNETPQNDKSDSTQPTEEEID